MSRQFRKGIQLAFPFFVERKSPQQGEECVKTLADALVRSQLVAQERHPDAIALRELRRGWEKAIRFVEKQSKASTLAISKLEFDNPKNFVPKYLDFNRVRMVARSFYYAFNPPTQDHPFLFDINEALRFQRENIKRQILKGIEVAYKTWLNNR